MSTGSLILVNGASSAGKSILCRAAQSTLPRAFLHHSLDTVFFGDALARDASGRPRDWSVLRPRVVDGFMRGLRGFLDAGVDVLCDYIVEDTAGRDRLVDVLDGADVFWVGLHVPLPELQRRERARGDRRVGDARQDLATVHTFLRYDLELDGTQSPEENAQRLLAAWSRRQT
ncbi:hypothetical protein ACHAAC_11440 [Aeromicrobium sp. CF4.19]|uniref:phosphotransferase-like protein n=1 Tax=Aeromicrobium sp. CF4.19 TaxID=3373082 RepID=UPI003EE61C64